MAYAPQRKMFLATALEILILLPSDSCTGLPLTTSSMHEINISTVLSKPAQNPHASNGRQKCNPVSWITRDETGQQTV